MPYGAPTWFPTNGLDEQHILAFYIKCVSPMGHPSVAYLRGQDTTDLACTSKWLSNGKALSINICHMNIVHINIVQQISSFAVTVVIPLFQFTLHGK